MKNLKFTLGVWPIITLVTVTLCFLTQWLAGVCGIALHPQTNLDVVLKHVGWNKTFYQMVFMVVVAAPAIEELIFRFILFKLPGWGFPVLGSGKGLLAMAAVSSALFAAAHYFENAWPDNAFLALFFFGLAQCWLYRRTSGLWCAMLNHALFNATNLTLLVCFPEMAKA